MALDFFKPISNIAPFTYRDGETYLQQLKRLRKWIDEVSTLANSQFHSIVNQFDAGMATTIAAAERAAADAAEAERLANIMVVAQDEAVALIVEDDDNLTDIALRERDARRIGPAFLTHETTATLRNRIDRLPASGGFVDIDRPVTLDDTLDLGDRMVHLRGQGKASSLISAPAGGLDKTLIKMVAGQRQKISNLTIKNDFAGNRTTYDIDIVNPWYATLDNVELQLSDQARLKGGVHVRRDNTAPMPDRSFMCNLHDLFVRNGHLVIEGVTDGIIRGGYIWGTYTQGVGTVEWRNSSGGWTVDGLSVVPTSNGGHVVTGGVTNMSIHQGQFDGSYADIQSGPGFKVADTGYVRGLSIQGVMAYNNWGSMIDLFNVRDAKIVGNVFRDGNKGNIAAPWIKLRSSRLVEIDNIYMGNVARTNPGLLIDANDVGNGPNVYGGTVESIDGAFAAPFVTTRPHDTVKGSSRGSWII